MNRRARAAALGIGLVALAGGFAPLPLIEAPPLHEPLDGVEPGLLLPGPPARLQVEPEPEPTIDRIRMHLEAGDPQRALRTARRFVAEHEWGRDRDAAWLVIGLLEREAGNHNLASEAFTRFRSSNGPLAPWGAYHEAEQDLERGRQWVAIKECERYRENWPRGPHAGGCLRIIALAHAELGRFSAARDAARQYDQEHENGHIAEQIELILARGLAREEPESAVGPLQHLAVTHQAPLTGRVAEDTLAALAARGIAGAALPEDVDAAIARAVSLRDAKRRDEAWALFEALAKAGDADPKVARFLQDQAERFGWRTHRWDFLAERYGSVHEELGRPEDAWNRYRVLDRGGRFAEAADFALEMQAKHAGAREWHRSHEEIGRTMMLAGRYAEARDQFDQVAARGGWTGRRGEFFAAFSSFMGGDAADAHRRFDAIIDKNKAWLIEARYWRARALDVLERPEDAAADRDWVLEHEPWSWYAALIRQSLGEAPIDPPLARSGRWVGEPPPSFDAPDPALHGHGFVASTIPVSLPVAGTPRRPPAGLASLTWPWDAPLTVANPIAALPVFDPERHPPRSYRPGKLWDPEKGRAALWRFAEQHESRWPELRAIADLARVGLYDISGPMMSSWYETWREDYRRGRANARAVGWLSQDQWRTLFLASRDHHHSARFSHGLWDQVEDEALRLEAWRLAYPLAHDQVVWEASRAHDIDPYMVLGLMRQESTYNAVAVSRVGARGAMQIMPRTGHLLADLAHDTEFTAGDLEDPVLSVQYGIRYLGLLMDRFDDRFPLALASYNGGPFNVSNWLSGTGSDIPMDAFVEHIPFRETRDYVKRVSSGYVAYVALYGPLEASVVVPEHPAGDHPEVVDF